MAEPLGRTPGPRRKGTFGSERPAQVDFDGFEWMAPSPTAWPDVKPDGHAGRPPGPRTSVVGYNRETKQIRTTFRDGTPWTYDGVTLHEWNALRRSPSTGRYINKRLNGSHGGPRGNGSRGWSSSALPYTEVPTPDDRRSRAQDDEAPGADPNQLRFDLGGL